MKNIFYATYFLLIAPLYVYAAAADASTSVESAGGANNNHRNLVIGDWDVRIDSVSGQTFTFSTGDGGAAFPYVQIEVYDVCRSDWSTRTDVGDFYPTPSVTGIAVDKSGTFTPGENNDIILSFVEGISGNTDIYTDNGDDTATVEFCAQIGLYLSSTLVNFAELKMTYTMDLTTSMTTLTGYTVTEADNFNDATDVNLIFDGTLSAYFCDPITRNQLIDDGSLTLQGSVLGICFKIPDGQFEIADVEELTLEKTGGTPSLQVVTVGALAPAMTDFATKTCTDTSTSDTNHCVVTALLTQSAFFEYASIALTGHGSIELELGDASGSRRELKKGNRERFFSVPFIIEPLELYTWEKADEAEKAQLSPASIVSLFFVAAVLFVVFSVRLYLFLFGVRIAKSPRSSAAATKATDENSLLTHEFALDTDTHDGDICFEKDFLHVRLEV